MLRPKKAHKIDELLLFRKEIFLTLNHLDSLESLSKTVKLTKIQSSIPFELTFKVNDISTNDKLSFTVTNKYGRVGAKVYGFATLNETISLTLIGGVHWNIIPLAIVFLLLIPFIYFSLSSPSVNALIFLSTLFLSLVVLIFANAIYIRNKILNTIIRRLQIYNHIG